MTVKTTPAELPFGVVCFIAGVTIIRQQKLSHGNFIYYR